MFLIAQASHELEHEGHIVYRGMASLLLSLSPSLPPHLSAKPTGGYHIELLQPEGV